MGFGMDMGWGWMWLFWLLLVVGAVLLTVVAVRSMGGGVARGGADGGREPQARHRAREILDERYARGELTADEYRERLRALEEDA